MQAYLIKSNSYRLLNIEINRILKDIENITNFSLSDVSIYDCIDDASYYGLFAEKRAIIIKDVKYFGGKFLYEEESEAIIKFLSHLDNETIIIFVCDDIKKTKDLTKKVIALGANIIDISTIQDADLIKICDEYAEEVQVKLESDARDLIIKNSLKNLDIVIQEIDKLSLASNHITIEVVKEHGSSSDDDETFNFSNAVIAKDFNKAFELLDKLLNNGIEAYALIGLLASSFTNMYMVKDAVNHNLTDEEIAKTFGYSGTGRVYVMKKNAKIYTLEQLKEIIISLSELDKKIKTGYNPVYGIKEFLLNL